MENWMIWWGCERGSRGCSIEDDGKGRSSVD